MIPFSRTSISCINPALNRVKVIDSSRERRIRYQYLSSLYTTSSSGLYYGAFIRRILEKVRSALSVSDIKQNIDFPLLPSIRSSSTNLEPYKEKSDHYSITVSKVKATMYNRVYILKKTVAKPRNIFPYSTIDFKSSNDRGIDLPMSCCKSTGVLFGSDFGVIMPTLCKKDNQDATNNSWSDDLLKPIDSAKRNYDENPSLDLKSQYNPSVGKNLYVNETNREFIKLKNSVNIVDNHLKNNTIQLDRLKVDSEKQAKGNRNYCSFNLEDGIVSKKSTQEDTSIVPDHKNKNVKKMQNNTLIKGLKKENSPYSRTKILKSKLRTIFYFENKSAYVIRSSKFDAGPVQEYIRKLAKHKKLGKPARINFVEFHRTPQTENVLWPYESALDVNTKSYPPCHEDNYMYRKETSISFENKNNKFWIPHKEENVHSTDVNIYQNEKLSDNLETNLYKESKRTQKLVEEKITEAKDTSDPYITKIPIKRDNLIEETVVPNKSILNIINSIDKSGIIIQKDLYITDQIIQKIKDKKKEKDKAEVQTSGLFEDQNSECILYFQVKSNDENGNVNVSFCDLTNKLTTEDFNKMLKANKTTFIKQADGNGDHNEVLLLENCGSGEVILLQPKMDEKKNIASFTCLGNATFKGISTIDIIKKSAALLEKEKYRQRRSSDSKEVDPKEKKKVMNQTNNKAKPIKAPNDINSTINNFHNNVAIKESSERCDPNDIELQLDVLLKTNLIKPELIKTEIKEGGYIIQNKINKNENCLNNDVPNIETLHNNPEGKKNPHVDEVNLNPICKNKNEKDSLYTGEKLLDNIEESIKGMKYDTPSSILSASGSYQNDNCNINKGDKPIDTCPSYNIENNFPEKEKVDSSLVKLTLKENNNAWNQKDEVTGLTVSVPALYQNKLINNLECSNTNGSKVQIERTHKGNQDKAIDNIPPVECPTLIDDSVQFLMANKNEGEGDSLKNHGPNKLSSGADRTFSKNVNTGIQHISKTSITAIKKNGTTDVKVSEKETVIDSRLPIPFSTETLFQIIGSSSRLRGLANVVDSAKNELIATNILNDTSTKDIIQKLDEILRIIKNSHILSLKSNKGENQNDKNPSGVISVDPEVKPSLPLKNREPRDIKVFSRSKIGKKTKSKMKRRNKHLQPGKNMSTSKNNLNQNNNKQFLKGFDKEGTFTAPIQVKNSAIPQKSMVPGGVEKPHFEKTDSKAQTKIKAENNITEQNINNYVHILKSVGRKNKTLKSKRRRPGFFDHKSLSKRDKKILKEILKGSQKKRNSIVRRSKDSSSKSNSKTQPILKINKQEDKSAKSGKTALENSEQNKTNLNAINAKKENSIQKNVISNKPTTEYVMLPQEMQNKPPRSPINLIKKGNDASHVNNPKDLTPKDIKDKAETKNTFMSSGFPIKPKTPKSPKNKTAPKLKSNKQNSSSYKNGKSLKKVANSPGKSKISSPLKKTSNMVKNIPISPKPKFGSPKSKDLSKSSAKNNQFQKNINNKVVNIDKNTKPPQLDVKTNNLNGSEIIKTDIIVDKNKTSVISEDKILTNIREHIEKNTQDSTSTANFIEKQQGIVITPENENNKSIRQLEKTKVEAMPQNMNSEDQKQNNKMPLSNHSSSNQNSISKSQILKKSNESNSVKATKNPVNNKFQVKHSEQHTKKNYSKKSVPSLDKQNQNANVPNQDLGSPVKNNGNTSPTFQIYVATKTSVDSKPKVKQLPPGDATNSMKENGLQIQTQTQRFKSRSNDDNVHKEKKLKETREPSVTVIERRIPKNIDSNDFKEKFKQELIHSAKKKIEQQSPIHFRVKKVKRIPVEEEPKVKSEKATLKPLPEKSPKQSMKSSEKNIKRPIIQPSKTLASSTDRKTTSTPPTKSSGKILSPNKSRKKHKSQQKSVQKMNMKAIKVYTERSSKASEESNKHSEEGNKSMSIKVDSISQKVDKDEQLIIVREKTEKHQLGVEKKESGKKNDSNEHLIMKEDKQLKNKTEMENNTTKEELSAKTKTVDNSIPAKENINDKIETFNKENNASHHKSIAVSSKAVESPPAKIIPNKPEEIIKSPVNQQPIILKEKETTPFPMLLVDLDKMTKEIKPEFDAKNAHTCAIPLKQVVNYPLINSQKSENLSSPNSVLNISPSKDPMLRKELSFFSSVTKILNITLPKDSRNVLRDWRRNMIKDLGDNGFKSYYKGQMTRGTQFHNLIQDYLVWGRGREKPTTQCFQSAYHILSDLTDLAAINSHVVHKPLAYRGVVDCVAKYKNKPVVIEWKRLDNKETLGQSSLAASFLQMSAYVGALNFDENYKFQVREGIIVIAYSDGNKADVHEVSRQDCEKFWKLWLDRLQSYHSYLQSRKK